MLSTHSAALEYAKLGYKVFPVHSVKDDGSCTCGDHSCKSKGKHPRTANGVKDATDHIATINWWAALYPDMGIAIATGQQSGFFVVDVDVKDGGVEAWEIYKQDNNIDDNETIIQRTQSGGYHVFFKQPESEQIKTATNVLGKGIDIRGEGGYIVAAPSRGYDFIDGQSPFDFDGEPDEAPQALVDRVKRNPLAEKAREKTTSLIEVGDSAWLSDDEIEKIQSALECIDHDDYSNWFNVGAALHQSADSRAFELWSDWSEKSSKFDPIEQGAAWDRYNQRKNTGVDAIELEWIYKAATDEGWAYEIDTSDCNFDTTPFEFEKLKQQLTRNVESGYPPCLYYDPSLIIHNLDTLNAYVEQNPTEKFLNGGMLYAGATFMIGGVPKIGKSKLLMQLLMAAALGGEFLGHKFTRPLKCLWIQPEIEPEFLKERMRQVAESISGDADKHTMFLNHFHVTDKARIDLSKLEHRVALSTIVEQAEYDIVALDPIANLTSIDENTNTEVMGFLKSLEDVKVARCKKRQKRHTAIIMAHHMSKSPDKDDPFSGFRGASAWRGYYDTGIIMRFNDDKEIQIDYELRNQASPEAHLIYFADGQVHVKKGGFDPNLGGIDTYTAELKEAGLTDAQIPVYRFAQKFIADNGKSMLQQISQALMDAEIIKGGNIAYYENMIQKSLTALVGKGDHLKLQHDGSVKWVS